jgi:hypothetical protein
VQTIRNDFMAPCCVRARACPCRQSGRLTINSGGTWQASHVASTRGSGAQGTPSWGAGRALPLDAPRAAGAGSFPARSLHAPAHGFLTPAAAAPDESCHTAAACALRTTGSPRCVPAATRGWARPPGCARHRRGHARERPAVRSASSARAPCAAFDASPTCVARSACHDARASQAFGCASRGANEAG